MRILLAATRRIHTTAVSLHLLALRIGVWGSDRTVAASMKATDAAITLRDVAVAGLSEARSIERTVTAANHAYRTAAQAEAKSLRRGYVL